MIKITTFQNPFDAQDAENVLRNRDAQVNVVKLEEVYYPYKRLHYSLTLPGKLTKLDKEFTCIVDLIYGRPAVAQGQPSFHEKEVSEEVLMESVIEDDKIHSIGYDFVFKLFLNKSKILNAPTITLLEESVFYKLFYIAQCKDEDENDYFILVDSMEASIMLLDWKPEEKLEEKGVLNEQK